MGDVTGENVEPACVVVGRGDGLVELISVVLVVVIVVVMSGIVVVKLVLDKFGVVGDDSDV